jgi:hypothetical protein
MTRMRSHIAAICSAAAVIVVAVAQPALRESRELAPRPFAGAFEGSQSLGDHDAETGPAPSETSHVRRSVGVVRPPPVDSPATEPTGGGVATSPVERATAEDRITAGPPSIDRQVMGDLDEPPLFASVCDYSHSAHDDPIVYPGRAGASHLHDFFGNTATDASSTDDSLRAHGRSTCEIDDSASYWVPALYDDGKRILPDRAKAYYTPGAKDFRTIEPFPRGLKIVTKPVPEWACSGDSPSPPSYSKPPACPSHLYLALRLWFPDCWDGRYLNVPDHASHMAFATYGMCPASHPVPVPKLGLVIEYPSDGGNITLAPKEDPSAPHADFVNAWDQPTLARLVRDCINSGVYCGHEPPA